MLRPGTYTVREYLVDHGSSRFRLWLETLDVTTRAGIQARILRFESGNFGDIKAIAKGIFEARIMFGPGYRVYFGVQQGIIILLLAGGDKSTQNAHIRTAQKSWLNLTESNK